MKDTMGASDQTNPSPAKPAIPLARQLQAVLPIGIPLGWQPQTAGQEKRFAVRRGSRFCHLDREGHDLWDAAWGGPSREVITDSMAKRWKREHHSVREDLDRFLAGRLLVQLGGDWREDWERIGGIRAVPRGFAIDSDDRRGFRMIPPGGLWEVWLSPADYAVWCFWDGSLGLDGSVCAAAEATGLAENMLKERAHSLLVAAVRAKAIFLDDSAPGGVGA